MIDWLLMILMAVGLGIVAYAAYREGVHEGWRQAGRWADESYESMFGTVEERPATRDDDEPLGV